MNFNNKCLAISKNNVFCIYSAKKIPEKFCGCTGNPNFVGYLKNIIKIEETFNRRM